VVHNTINIHHTVMGQKYVALDVHVGVDLTQLDSLTHLRTMLPLEVHSCVAEFNLSPTCWAKLCMQNPNTGVVNKPQYPVTFKDIDLHPMFQVQAVSSVTTPAANSMGVLTSTDIGLC
jgi:hypothetical protein